MIMLEIGKSLTEKLLMEFASFRKFSNKTYFRLISVELTNWEAKKNKEVKYDSTN